MLLTKVSGSVFSADISENDEFQDGDRSTRVSKTYLRNGKVFQQIAHITGQS